MFKRLQKADEAEAGRWVKRARLSPVSDPAIEYPEWYLHRWHFLPEGYLAPRSVALYRQRIATVYNVWNERGVLRAVAGFVRAAGAARALEIGCGAGAGIAALCELPGIRLTGVDLSPFMIEAARARLGDTGAELVHGDCTDLRFDSGQLDAVVAVHVLGHLPGHVAAAAADEAARVLRPGGSLVVADHAWHRLPLAGWRQVGRARVAGGVIQVRQFERPPA